jgi:hypothetical protein
MSSTKPSEGWVAKSRQEHKRKFDNVAADLKSSVSPHFLMMMGARISEVGFLLHSFRLLSTDLAHHTRQKSISLQYIRKILSDQN